MTKEQARDILNQWLEDNTREEYGTVYPPVLPIKDEVVFRKETPEGTVEHWTFKGLIVTAYDL